MAIPISVKYQALYSPLFSRYRCNQVTSKLYLYPLSSLIRTRIRNPISIRHSSLSSSASPITPSYSGWDDVTLDESFTGGEKGNPIRNFLFSIGITDGKYGILFLLGFLAALAVSRVRVSPFSLLPISALVFVTGFAAGMARDGFGSKSSEIRASDEKFKVLKSIIGELEVKMSELKNGLVTIGELGQLERMKIRNSIDIVDYVKNKLGNVANDIDKDLDSGEIVEGEKKSNQKTTQKRKSLEMENVASDIVKYFRGLIQENISELNSPSTKIINKKENLEEKNMKRDEILVSSNSLKSEGPSEIPAKKSNNSKFVELKEDILDGTTKNKPAYSDMLSFDDNNNNSRLHFTRKQGYSERTIVKDKNSKFGKTDLFHESEETSVLEQTLEIRNRSYKFKFEQTGENNLDNSNTKTENQIDDTSNKEQFNQNLKSASEILTVAREYTKNKNYDEEKIDSLLYQSSTLLCTAISLKPNSILALGQLGNTYLLHGELKLKISRELRSLLSNKEGLGFKKKMASKQGIAPVLVEVCEECENLLIEAGRNYRKVLTIDGNDVKALYNWGLALSFRAQLISDIGPEGAIDADKIYLAAIDKFDAMLSKNNSYAPEALYRWGMALQNRSHLRVRNDKEKIKLLYQAKSLFEEVLSFEADNRTVQYALSKCVSELEYNDTLI